MAECILYYSYADRKTNDFFLATGTNSNGRKKQNLHALYSILEYCEEPFLCRRKMQLQFLGEEFDESNCPRNCDNCKAGFRVTANDLTQQA